MKTLTKPLMGLLLLVILLSLSCNKPDNPPPGYVRAVFTGIDYKMCMCCGGYYFTVNNKKYRALDIVKNTVLNEHTRFPKTCFIKFEVPSGGCYGYGEITVVRVTAIKNVK